MYQAKQDCPSSLDPAAERRVQALRVCLSFNVWLIVSLVPLEWGRAAFLSFNIKGLDALSEIRLLQGGGDVSCEGRQVAADSLLSCDSLTCQIPLEALASSSTLATKLRSNNRMLRAPAWLASSSKRVQKSRGGRLWKWCSKYPGPFCVVQCWALLLVPRTITEIGWTSVQVFMDVWVLRSETSLALCPGPVSVIGWAKQSVQGPSLHRSVAPMHQLCPREPVAKAGLLTYCVSPGLL